MTNRHNKLFNNNINNNNKKNVKSYLNRLVRLLECGQQLRIQIFR